MLKLFIISALLVGCYANIEPQSFIVNGTDAKPGEIPSIVALRFLGKHDCGGSILDKTHILTACHCVYGRSASVLSIQYGILHLGNNKNVIDVKGIQMHPKFKMTGSLPNDVAVLKLKTPIPFSAEVQPTTLPNHNDPTPANSPAVLAGWGRTATSEPPSNILKRVDLNIYSDRDCEIRHHGKANREWHICAGIPEGGKGQCSGDSGGPLFVKGVQRGIVSWSVKPCAIKGFPGVYTNVANYVNWIKDQMKK